MTVGADETAATLTVTATSTVDNAKSGTATVTVTTPAPTVNSVTASPATALVQQGNTQTFSATVMGSSNLDQSVTWSVNGSSSNTKIDTDGKLTVGADETAAALTVTATSTVDNAEIGSIPDSV